MKIDCCLHGPLPHLLEVLLAPGNSSRAVDLITEMLERCRQCESKDCPGLGEILILATVQSAVDRCEEEAAKQPGFGALNPGPQTVPG